MQDRNQRCSHDYWPVRGIMDDTKIELKVNTSEYLIRTVLRQGIPAVFFSTN
jgi:hypothetical protein